MREQILALLERNSKMTPEEIAVLLGSSKEMIAEEIRRMEAENIICGYNTLINWDHTGAATTCLLSWKESLSKTSRPLYTASCPRWTVSSRRRLILS